jgi:hypothetical protein
MKLKKLLAATAACVALGFACAPVQADPINAAQWYEFRFGATGSALTNGAGAVPGVLSIFAPDTPWTINLATAMELVVTDGFQQGDEFQLSDFGAAILSTSATPNDGAHSCGNDEVACLADPLMSHGTIVLAAGLHSLTGIVTDSPFGGGAAFFIIRAIRVPEPGTLALIALAGLAAGALRRRGGRS